MQSIKLSIPTPCHENWDNMTPTEQGRFCSVCAKQVVDFTKMSDYEVLNYFNKVQGEKVCGRTLSNQLERELEAPKPIVQSKLWYWKYAAAGLMFFTKINDIEAQNVTPLTPVQLNTLNKDTLKGRLGFVAVENKKIITGKILDTDGNVVPFASVKIMGTKYGTSANANGIYSIKVNANTDILEFSAVGYKVNHLVLKENVKFDIILENSYSRLQGEVVIVTGGVSVNYNDNEYVAKTQQKHIAMLKIEDELTKKNIPQASITILKDNTEKTVNIDKRGIYKLKEIKNEESVVIKISAYGYENKELVIKGENFNNRKEVFEIGLVKIPTQFNITPKKGGDTRVILGGMISTEIRKEPLYVVDGKIISNPNDIDIYNIEDITVLKGNEATALFGVDGSNGAIVIKLKKRKLLPDSNKLPAYKTLENVMVISGYTKGRISCVSTGATIVKGEMVDSLSISELLTKKISSPPQNLFLPLKIYPNPVQKGQTIHISFSNKGTTHTIQITNSLGVVVLSKRCGSGVLPSEIHAKSTEEIPIDIQWSSGMYYISVLNENNVVIAQSSFFVF